VAGDRADSRCGSTKMTRLRFRNTLKNSRYSNIYPALIYLVPRRQTDAVPASTPFSLNRANFKKIIHFDAASAQAQAQAREMMRLRLHKATDMNFYRAVGLIMCEQFWTMQYIS
jgi:hypothetical protein